MNQSKKTRNKHVTLKPAVSHDDLSEGIELGEESVGTISNLHEKDCGDCGDDFSKLE